MRWAIISGMYNVADLVTEFCRYHLGLGVDKIFAVEYGSNDGTVERLRPFVEAGRVELVPLPTHRFVDYDPSNAVLGTIRAHDTADWVSFLDPDEFLAGPANLKEFLSQEWERGTDAIAVPRFNLTGLGPPPSSVHYMAHLTLKIAKIYFRFSSASTPLFSPWIFYRLAPKVMVRAQNSLTTSIGDHNLHGLKEDLVPSSSFEILHLPMRSYESFQVKIACGMGYFAKNQEFAPIIGWHWRRWIDLFQSGGLREEYESQFLEAAAVEALLKEGQIVPEMRLANWWADEQKIPGTSARFPIL